MIFNIITHHINTLHRIILFFNIYIKIYSCIKMLTRDCDKFDFVTVNLLIYIQFVYLYVTLRIMPYADDVSKFLM